MTKEEFQVSLKKNRADEVLLTLFDDMPQDQYRDSNSVWHQDLYGKAFYPMIKTGKMQSLQGPSIDLPDKCILNHSVQQH